MVKFFVATDTQLGMTDNFLSRGDVKEYAEKWISASGFSQEQFLNHKDNVGLRKELRNLRKVVSIANEQKPDFLVITGDILDDIHDDYSKEKFKNEIENLDDSIKLYLVPGNHDVGEDPLVPSRTGIARYKELFGKDYYSFEIKGILFVVINSSLFMAPKVLQSEFLQQNRYIQELIKAEDPKKPIIIFSHHPPYLDKQFPAEFGKKTKQESDGYWEFPIETRESLFKIINGKNVMAFFTGHLHENKITRFKNIDIIVTSAIGLPLGNDPSGYRVVEILNQKFEHKFYSI